MSRKSVILLACLTAVVGAPCGAQARENPFFEFQVTKPAFQIPGSKQPLFPQTLKAAGVEGEVLAQFVLDTLGVPEVFTFKVLKTSHELFAAAVKAALPEMRYEPAELNGRKVKQLVQQPFIFAIDRVDGSARPAPVTLRPLSSPGENTVIAPTPHTGTVDGVMMAHRFTVDSGNGGTAFVLSVRQWIANGRARVEVSASNSPFPTGAIAMIYDSTARKVTLVNSPMKTATLTPLEPVGTPPLHTASTWRTNTVRDLGAGERILGVETRHYAIQGTVESRTTLGSRTCVTEHRTSSEFWTTQDAELAASARRARSIQSVIGSTTPAISLDEAAAGVPGGVVLRSITKTTATTAQGTARTVTSVREVTELKQGPIAAALFDPPEGFRVFDRSQPVPAERRDSVARAMAERLFARMADSSATTGNKTVRCTGSKAP